MSNEEIKLGWKYAEPSSKSGVSMCEVDVEVTLGVEEAGQYLQKVANGQRLEHSRKEIREDLKSEAEKVEIEKVHRNPEPKTIGDSNE